MSIASEITRIQGNISDAYTAAQAKGATMPTTQNSDNLASTISTISGGGVDTTHWIPKEVDSNGKLVSSGIMPNFTGVTDVGDYALMYAYMNVTSLNGAISFPDLTQVTGASALYSVFERCTGLTSASFPVLTQITSDRGLYYMFYDCTGLTSASFPSLTTASGAYCMQSIFYDCTYLTSALLPDLTQVTGASALYGVFNHCTRLASVDLGSLTTISGDNSFEHAFDNCTGLTSVSLPSLTTISGYYCMRQTFYVCRSLTSVSFPSITSNTFGSNTNQFNNMVSGVTGCTIHFPSNLDPQTGSTVISSLSGYPNFGGTNTVLAFDLPATNTLTGADSETYSRNPKYDTATALAWKVGAYGTTNFDPAYYTSGTSDPVVGDTIYSDANCTTAVTTISSIS